MPSCAMLAVVHSRGSTPASSKRTWKRWKPDAVRNPKSMVSPLNRAPKEVLLTGEQPPGGLATSTERHVGAEGAGGPNRGSGVTRIALRRKNRTAPDPAVAPSSRKSPGSSPTPTPWALRPGGDRRSPRCATMCGAVSVPRFEHVAQPLASWHRSRPVPIITAIAADVQPFRSRRVQP